MDKIAEVLAKEVVAGGKLAALKSMQGPKRNFMNTVKNKKLQLTKHIRENEQRFQALFEE